MDPILCILGPTAAGKTAAAFALCDQYHYEIISVDSAMIYRGLDIGAAKPDRQTLKKYPHHLVDILEPEDSYSAAQFVSDAYAAIEAILKKGKKPLLVGGTMLYFKALQQGLSELPESDPKVRAQIETEMTIKGVKALHDELKQLDPEAASQIHENDPQRIQRALELVRMTGKTRGELWQQKKVASPYQFQNVLIMPTDRAQLHQRIEQRFLQMCAQGFEEEVKKLMARNPLSLSHPAMRAVGYRQMWQYLQGEFSYTQMQARAIAATRQLAKRQLTWLRAWPDVYKRVDMDEALV